jgi:hypothetical protein
MPDIHVYSKPISLETTKVRCHRAFLANLLESNQVNNNNNNNNNNNILTAIGLSPDGSGYFTCKMFMSYTILCSAVVIYYAKFTVYFSFSI